MSMMTHTPTPLISLPVNEPSDDSDSDDVMTKEEEEAARKYLQASLGTNGGETQRRMSSLDIYLSTPKEEPEQLLLNRRKSIRDEQEEISHYDFEAIEKQEQAERNLKNLIVRENIKEDRRRKTIMKEEIIKERENFEKRMQLMKERTRRGLGGLTREKRRRLKEMILNKAHEEMKNERRKLAEERKKYLETLIQPLAMDNLSEDELRRKVLELYQRAVELENLKFDLEQKLNRQELEMHDLTEKMSELKGKYNRPVLRKVCKRETKLEKLMRLRETASCNPPVVRERLRKTSNASQNHSS